MISRREPLTVSATLREGVQRCAALGETARADAQILLGFVLGRDRAWLLAHGETYLSRAQSDRYAALCERRSAGVPVAYLTGFAGFYGREFSVNERVLIPRPESEHLVDDALAHLRAKAHAGVAQTAREVWAFEAGIGSGAIACTIAAEVAHARVEGTDVSAAAVETANDNARRLGVRERCTFYVADIARDFVDRRYDVVVANLPYIPTADIPRKPDPAGYEPVLALDGGADGLDQYRKLLARAERLLQPDGLLLLEAAPPTIDALQRLTASALPRAAIELRRDYAGLARYLSVKQNAAAGAA